MSASNKKKLRKEQIAAQLTEKQRKEQLEAKKLKAYSVIFIAVILVVAVVALSVMAVKAVNRSGIIDRNTVALTVGEHEVTSVELNYYFNDLVNSTYQEWYNTYGDDTATYMLLMGLDVSAPLDEQEYEDGKTWADNFMETAKNTAKNDYILYDKAMAEGFTLPEEDKTSLEAGLSNLELYSQLYGYADLEDYLVAIYGFGADETSYKAYTEKSALAGAYYEAYSEALTYDDAAIREYEKEHFDEFSSFTFASVYLPYTDFLSGGTTDENGTTTYSDEEKDAARDAAKAAAEELSKSANVLELNKAYAALDIHDEGEEATATTNTRKMSTAISETYRDWVMESSRKENDITVVANESTTTDSDGNTSTTVNGYYVILFQERDDNTKYMSNVRHVLIKPQGGTEDEETGETIYSDEELAAAKETADMLLRTWQEDGASEDAFITMVEESSEDTGSSETGGLYEDIHADSSYVAGFLDWCIDPARKTGDAEVVESEFGYHIMYYVGDDELTYRDYMITEALRTADVEAWHSELMDAVTVTEGDISRINTALVLG